MNTHFTARMKTRLLMVLAGLMTALPMTGCEVDSFWDPSRTGYFEHTPTTVPILERIDVIESQDDVWGQTTSVAPDDLIPSDLTYTMVPGDIITVAIFELYAQGQWTTSTRRVDQSGSVRLPELGEVMAAGLAPQGLEDEIVARLRQGMIVNPQVQVTIEEGGGFNYTIYGFVGQPGVFTLRNPDLRLLDALAIVGGVPVSTKKIYIIREVPLSDDVRPQYEQNRNTGNTGGGGARPVDIDELINDLDDGGAQPGAFRQVGDPPIDIDDLDPVRSSRQPAVDLYSVEADGGGRASYVYVPERDEWVPIRVASIQDSGSGGSAPPDSSEQMILERIIQIDYQRLSKGDSSMNLVIRPNDRIYVDGPPSGLVYIDGEVIRPGVYNLPTNGQLTLSRLIATAGGLNPTAIPERIDLTRVVGDNREATVRLNLSAIRQRTEPDLYLRPDDHIIVGTNWIATPLAIIRNGFRMTYGFGFLLDRNFGNDVFGAPPVNFR